MLGLRIIAMFLEAVGTIMIGAMALRVHDHVRRERTIDDEVRSEMRREQLLGRIALSLIGLGFLIETTELVFWS